MIEEITTDSIEILAGTSSGDYGDDEVLSWEDPEVVGEFVECCSVQPLPGSEYTLDRNAVVSRAEVFVFPQFMADPPADPTSINRIRWQGDEWEIDGDVLRFRDLTGSDLDHLTFLVKRTVG